MNHASPRIIAALFIALAVTVPRLPASGAELQVCPSGCTYSTIQSAIDAAGTGDTVTVGIGTYYEHINFLGKAITVASSWGAGSTIIDGSNSGRVVTFNSGEGASSVLQGFAVTRGYNSDTTTENGYGAGIFVKSSSPTILDCVVSANVSDGAGGGIGIGSGSPSISGCTVTGNTAKGQSGMHTGGGGIYGYWSNPVVEDTSIDGNTSWMDGGGVKLRYADATSSFTLSTVSGNAAINGGGISISDSQPVFHDCAIIGNQAMNGGGIYNAPIVADDLPTFDGCQITGNSATSGHGGGVWAAYRLELESCVVAGNQASADGGGIYGAVRSMSNCTVSGNHAGGNGGGIHYRLTWDPSPNAVTYLNNTVAGNSADGMGGGLFVTQGYPALANGVFWGNAPDQVRLYEMATIDITYSAVEGGDPADPSLPWPGEGNILEDPLFLDQRPSSEAPTASGDYRLADISGCLDRGTADGAPTWDIEGEARPWGMGVDMGSDEAMPLVFNGAFEYGSGAPAPWVGSKLVARDKRVSGVSHNGSSSFRILGSAAGKSLRQVVSLGGSAGDSYLLGGWSKARAASATGGTYGLQAKIFYTDGTAARFKVGFTKSGHPWEHREKAFQSAKDYTKIVVYLIYARQAGKAWFDDITLVKQ